MVFLQGATFAVLPAADAVLEAGWSGAEAHVEETSGEHCETGHSHLLCQLARTASPGFPPLILFGFASMPEVGIDAPTATASQRRPVPSGGSGPRAPPPA